MSDRQLALLFGGAHVAVCLVGLVAPATYGLGIAADPAARRRLRALAAVDLLFAGAVVDAVVRDLPIDNRLRVGAGSDLIRAFAIVALFPGRAPVSRTALVAASLAGAVTASRLRPRR